ncbi:MAG TPA: hypothetical protein VJ768_00625, partial [Anaerolineales bacterium]|nr:hypothetical protein [Anaerolineales bacterium]
LTPAYLAEIIRLVDSGEVNTPTGKALLTKVEESGQAPSSIVKAEGLGKVSDADAIQSLCLEVIRENPEQVAMFRGGKETLMGWFVGQVMKKSRGKADPKIAQETLLELLAERD